MFEEGILSLIIKNLGIIGFIVFLFFILISLYVKKTSERKILIYVFSALAFLVVSFSLFSQKMDAENSTNAPVSTSNQNLNNSTVKGSVSLNHKSDAIKSEANQTINGSEITGDVSLDHNNTVKGKDE